MKHLFTIALLTTTVTLNAQTWIDDSVSTGPGYPNRVFYSLQNGIQGTMSFNDKDLLVDVSQVYSATIRINGGFNAALWEYTAGDTTDWATLDTTGMAAGTGFNRLWDQEDYWSLSAFEQGATGHPDYGWGTYNSVTHDVVGHKIFVYKTVQGGFKKLWIKKLSAMTSEYTILSANVDGSSEYTITISKQGITDKSFVYYRFADDSTYNLEPAITDFDLVFTKHVGFYGTNPNQAVTGVEINHNVLVAAADNIVPDDAVYTSYSLTETLNGIGSGWKYLNMSFQWEVEDSLSYFVQDVGGNIWQIRFTGFGGSTNGKYKFQKRQVAWASVENENGAIANFTVFPNPVSDYMTLAYTMKDINNNASLSILDMSGRVVYMQTLAASEGFNQTQVDIASLQLPAGIYVARVQMGNSSGVKKFIVK